MFRDRDDFDATILTAAENLELPPVAVEKDYWVTEALRRLANEFKPDFVFKGGTSLTKALHVTNRFSEDIDVLIVKSDKSWGACDRLMKDMAAAVAEALDGAIESKNAQTGRHRTYTVTYSAQQPPTAVISPQIELEMGVRGGPNPCSELAISSFLHDELAAGGFDVQAHDDLAPVSLLVLHPGRTLVEKLFNVHAAAVRLENGRIPKPPARTERHLFDIHELLGAEQVIAFLRDREQFQQIVSDVSDISREFFSIPDEDPIERPDDGFGSSPAFTSRGEVDRMLKDSYNSSMPALYYGPRLPSWEEIKSKVMEHADLL